MRILGIDSSTPEAGIALLENGQLVSQSISNNQPAHSNHLLVMLDEVLRSSRLALEDVDGFAVTVGPGSFTGLRVGISLVKGLVLATEKPFVGVSTLEALAAASPKTDRVLCPALDARKQQVYFALFRHKGPELERLAADNVLSPEQLCETISEPAVFLGTGADRYSNFLKDRLGSHYRSLLPDQRRSIAAGAGYLATQRFDQAKNYDLDHLQINYIRKSEAEIKLDVQTR